MHAANPELSCFPRKFLHFVSIRIFKKIGIIASGVGATNLRPFQAFSADLAHEPGEPIHFFTGLSPKSESRAIRLMTSVLREAEERIRLVCASRIEDSPTSARAIAGKTENWQQLSIKLVCASGRLHAGQYGPS